MLRGSDRSRVTDRRAGVAVAVVASALAVGVTYLTVGGASAQAARARGAARTGSRRTGGSGEQALTASQLAADLRAAASIRKVPANLTPPLFDKSLWGSLIVENGCQLSALSPAMSPPCVYGDPNGPVSVVLFGDSHASVWFPALDQLSIQRHWRLLIFTRAGCSPPEVALNPPPRAAICDAWRQNSEAQIAALHPALVFVSWARWIEDGALPEAGVPTGFLTPWLDGIVATFNFLRQSSGGVIFISDVPTLKFGAARCLYHHLTDVKPCNSTPRSKAIFLPQVRADEFELADLMGVPSIDPTSWFCTATVCPVLVRNIMVYYDSAHMTPAWSSFIEPVFATSVKSILNTPQAVTHP
jgi:hypothetical protein